MKLHKLLLLSAVVLVLLYNTSCTSSTRGFDSSLYEKEEVKCKVLSDVRLNLIPFTNGPLLYSSVKIQILEPEHLKNDDTELILQQRISQKYTGHEDGELWHDIGSIHDITIYRNIRNSAIYLYPEAKGGWGQPKKKGVTGMIRRDR